MSRKPVMTRRIRRHEEHTNHEAWAIPYGDLVTLLLAFFVVMYVELNMREHADVNAAKVFEGMGIYSPTLGIIGAVLGLMAVLQNLADPSKLGHGIAAAFTATVYGIGLANLLFLPVASKLKAIIHRQTQFREMVIDGMLCIAQGENPRAIEAKLQGYLH